MGAGTPAAVPVEFFFDYICPFCYVASARLERVAGRHPLRLRHRFLEIHPDNPPEGRPLAELGYPPEQWERLTRTAEAMIEAEALPWRRRTFTTNSRRALLLGRTVRRRAPARFPDLHRALFRAYFAEGRNIGDPDVLRELARDTGVEPLVTEAWDTAGPLEALLADVEAARRVGVTGVPALWVGGRLFPGADAVDTLEQALDASTGAGG